MGTRFDHAEAAVSMLRDVQDVSDLLVLSTLAAGAQVHATLALVEQQRIANLIAWATAEGHEPSEWTVKEVWKGLGR